MGLFCDELQSKASLFARPFCGWHSLPAARRFLHELFAKLDGVAPPTSFVYRRPMKINLYFVERRCEA
jgi:hypothetical protein